MNGPIKVSLMVVAVFGTTLPQAQQPDQGRADGLSFFDYLGMMIEEQGEWVDPLTMEQAEEFESWSNPAAVATEKTSVDVADPVEEVRP